MNTTALAPAAKADASLVRFVPYGGADEIKLSIKIVQDIIAVPTRSGATCSQRDALKFIAMCQAKKLNPFEGDAFLIGYDSQDGPSFSLITAHQAFLKRAELHPEYDGMESGIVVIEGEDGVPTDISGDFHTDSQAVVGGWAKVHYKNRKFPTYRRLRLARFNTGRAQWKTDPAGMICKCAEADALRSSFPTMLGGMYMDGEAHLDVAPRKQAEDGGAGLVSVISSAASDRGERVAQIQHGNQDEAAEAEAGLAPAQTQESIQTVLSESITALGFDFQTFTKWAAQSGQIKDADSLPDFNAVSSGDAERLLRALRGGDKTRAKIIGELTKAKEQLV